MLTLRCEKKRERDMNEKRQKKSQAVAQEQANKVSLITTRTKHVQKKAPASNHTANVSFK